MFRWKVADVDSILPASERYFAYILPMAPIPMSPIVGCASRGEDVETFGSIMIVRRADSTEKFERRGPWDSWRLNSWTQTNRWATKTWSTQEQSFLGFAGLRKPEVRFLSLDGYVPIRSVSFNHKLHHRSSSHFSYTVLLTSFLLYQVYPGLLHVHEFQDLHRSCTESLPNPTKTKSLWCRSLSHHLLGLTAKSASAGNFFFQICKITSLGQYEGLKCDDSETRVLNGKRDDKV